MSSDLDAKLAKIMPQVAEIVLGEFHGAKNKALSTKTELRWGKKGSISVDLAKGTWYDHTEQDGGGVLKLLQAFKSLDAGEAMEWLEARGLWESRKRPESKYDSVQGGAPQGPFAGFLDDWPIAIFKYYDDAGALAYEVLKFAKTAPRRYMQRRPHPDGKGWIWGLQEGQYGRVRSGDWFKSKDDKKYSETATFPDATRWLYHRDEVLNARDEGRPVFLVEGERDVETVRAWGQVATTNAGGAKYWTEQFDDDLTGCDVILIGDNDVPGRQRLMLRGASLRGRASSIRLLDIAEHWHGMPEGADVSDWRDQAGGTKELFEKLVAEAHPFRIEAPQSRYKALQWHELDKAGDDLEFMIDGWLTKGERSVMAGPSRSGKSFLAIHAALSIARGTDFFGHRSEQMGVVYQAGEGAKGIKRRVRAYREHFDVGPEADVPFVLLGSKVDLFNRDGDTTPLIDEIKAWALTMSVPLGLVVIDTYATASTGSNENDGRDVGMVLANIDRINKETGAAVMLVHHMNADGTKIRGHTSLFANVDQVVGVTHDEESGERTATLVKQKDDEDGLKINFMLSQVKLGRDERAGRDITSCICVTAEEKASIVESRKQGYSLNATERAIMSTLLQVAKDRGVYIRNGDPDRPRPMWNKQIVTWDDYRDHALRRITVEDRKKAVDKVRHDFNRVKDRLIEANVLGFDFPHLWWAGRPLRGYPETQPDLQVAPELSRQQEIDGKEFLDAEIAF